MYRGFNLKIPENLVTEYYEKGLEIYDQHLTDIKATLDQFLLDDNSLSGTKIIENWFPQINAHIFLSHSHADERKAIQLAGILHEKFDLITFIDSCIWGYSTDLLKEIDNNYCLNPSGKTYNYQKRNYSTSHVNLMLSTALNKMIDHCECTFFLNTPNAISSEDAVSKTKSPWIFSEIATTQTIRRKRPYRPKLSLNKFSKGGPLNENARESLSIKYDLELSHFSEITLNDLSNWINLTAASASDALDNLYRLKSVKNKLNPSIYG